MSDAGDEHINILPPPAELPPSEGQPKPQVVDINALIEGFGRLVEESKQDTIKQVDSLVSSKINAANIEMARTLNEHADRLNQLTELANRGGGAGTAAAGPAGQRQQQNNPLLDMAIQELMPIVRQKLGTAENPLDGEINQLIGAQWNVAKLEFRNALRQNVRKAFRKGMLLPEQVDGLIDVAADRVVEHGTGPSV